MSDGDRVTPTTSTRDLLVCAALGAIVALLIVLTMPLTRTLALVSPPLYALVAALPTAFFYLAVRSANIRFGAATLVAVLSAVLAMPFTTLGLLLVIPLVAQGLAIDLVLFRRRTELAYYVAGLASAVVVFCVTLPVFSAEHLTVWWLLFTVLGRLVGAALAVAASLWLFRRVFARRTAPRAS